MDELTEEEIDALERIYRLAKIRASEEGHASFSYAGLTGFEVRIWKDEFATFLPHKEWLDSHRFKIEYDMYEKSSDHSSVAEAFQSAFQARRKQCAVCKNCDALKAG